MPDSMSLYHTGFQEIRKPDIRHGRKNADFGQGFYLSDDEAFSRRWAAERKDASTILNRYELTAAGLKVMRFSRDEAWYRYIFSNRAARPDYLAEYDVIIGPIANDTIFDTFGILTSGLISEDLALGMLRTGPCYRQVVLKTQKAADALRFVSSEVLPHDEITQYRQRVREEEAAFQKECARLLT